MIGRSALSAVNLAEVIYHARDEGMKTAGLREDLEGYGVAFVDFTSEHAPLVEEVRAAAMKQNARLSIADCCCLATAIGLNLPVVTADRAWETLRIGVEVHPFR